LVQEIPLKGIIEVEFSPRGTFLSTWERLVKTPDSETNPHKNLVIWDVLSGEQVLGLTQKNQSGWNVNWTEDESYCARLVSNEVQFYESRNLKAGIHSRLKLDGIADFSLSPGKRPIVAVFVPEKKGQPAAVKLFDLTGLSTPLAQKSFYRADNVQFHWNKLGTNILVFTHTEVDKTGKSYYGETHLYYLSITGNYDCQVELDKPGPIHDVSWSPNSKEFIVVYGSMPAKATLFDHRASAIYEFGSAARNQVRYSPHGRLFYIAGFGNLAGDMDIWDRKTFKKIATISASNSSSCDWCPDSRHIMTSSLYRRLKVDNGIKIWHYTGALVHTVDVKEMYQTAWRPERPDVWPELRSISPAPQPIAATASSPAPGNKRLP
ncbi:eukaryotic translation initiation factor eIF2A-domain-containing protein, partial [Blyttiomyces helicus]